MLTEFGKFLRIIRMNEGEKAGDMAKKLLISTSYLYMIENGERGIPADMENNIINAYGISDDDKRELHRLIVYSERASENADSQIADSTGGDAEDGGVAKKSVIGKKWVVAICIGLAVAAIAGAVIFTVYHFGHKKKKTVTDITVEQLVAEILSTTITEQQAESYKDLSVEEIREKVKTVGDAILVLDALNNKYMSGWTEVYNPVGNMNDMKTLDETDSTKYAFLAGYFVQDTMPDVECIYTDCESDGFAWPYAALLIPTDYGYLILSPGAFSANKENNRCMIGTFVPCIISDKSELRDNLVSAGLVDNAEIGTVYVFTPDDTVHTFQSVGGMILCNNLTPIE